MSSEETDANADDLSYTVLGLLMISVVPAVAAGVIIWLWFDAESRLKIPAAVSVAWVIFIPSALLVGWAALQGARRFLSGSAMYLAVVYILSYGFFIPVVGFTWPVKVWPDLTAETLIVSGIISGKELHPAHPQLGPERCELDIGKETFTTGGSACGKFSIGDAVEVGYKPNTRLVVFVRHPD